MAVDYFLTDKFINWEMTRHSIVYDAPFLALGGAIFLYKDSIKTFVEKWRWPFLVLCIGLTCIYWFVPSTHKGYLFVVVMSLITAAWLCYAIGSNGKILNNKAVKYLSSISMEIYLCHMMCFRTVQFLHVDNFINNIYLVYWATCVLTLSVAIVFSHGVKFVFLPKFSLIFNKKKDING